MALFPGFLLRCSFVASTHVVSYLIVLLEMSPFPYQNAKHTKGGREGNECMKNGERFQIRLS
jgi:hypothetical protein